jgi:hypothetical protein
VSRFFGEIGGGTKLFSKKHEPWERRNKRKAEGA